MRMYSIHRSNIKSRTAFTLIELLVVVAIIAMLISILLPTLSTVRAQGAAVKCKANLHVIGIGLVMYNQQNDDYIVPSYNLPWAPGSTTNYTGGPEQPLDGWGAILDRDGFIASNQRAANTIFYCPRTVDVEGMETGQTGDDPRKPRGWTDWPLKFTTVGGDSSPKVATTIPELGFNKIIRVSYWINAYNPIGNQPLNIPALDQHYTASIALGPDQQPEEFFLQPRKLQHAAPFKFIVVSDGIYMGRQAVTRLGDTNSRIGYRHPGMSILEGAANIVLADGHVETLMGNEFPRALGSTDPPELIQEKMKENYRGPTIYNDPYKVFEPYE
ncbi:MAG: hypothetical protein HJJLKODD_00305 [Phycisphaerae bacterium]|nr:hypothetical protein [Phycisphaerae bacterium]